MPKKNIQIGQDHQGGSDKGAFKPHCQGKHTNIQDNGKIDQRPQEHGARNEQENRREDLGNAYESIIIARMVQGREIGPHGMDLRQAAGKAFAHNFHDTRKNEGVCQEQAAYDIEIPMPSILPGL